MKHFAIALATIAALALGVSAGADARDKGRRDGAYPQRHASGQQHAHPSKFQHAVDRRQAGQRARIREGWQSGNLNRHEISRLGRDQARIGRLERRFGADGRYTRHERRALKGALDHSSKRIWRMKHNRHGWKHGHGKRYGHYKHHRHHKRFRHGYRPPGHRRHHHRRHRPWAYPVYLEASPGYSRGLEVETEEFRFKVYGSG